MRFKLILKIIQKKTNSIPIFYDSHIIIIKNYNIFELKFIIGVFFLFFLPF